MPLSKESKGRGIRSFIVLWQLPLLGVNKACFGAQKYSRPLRLFKRCSQREKSCSEAAQFSEKVRKDLPTYDPGLRKFT